MAERDPTTASLPAEYARLEASVRRLCDELAGYRARARLAESRASDLEGTLKAMSTGSLDPIALRDRLQRLEEENRSLRRRMAEAAERIRRLMARFDFLREDG